MPYDSVHHELSQSTTKIIEPSFFLWYYPPGLKAQDQQFPPPGEFASYDKDLKATDLGFEQINEVFVPQHANMFIYGNHDLIYKVHGPAWITNTNAHHARWKRRDNLMDKEKHPYISEHVGKKVRWQFGPGSQQIHHVRFERDTGGWDGYVDRIAGLKQHNLTFRGQEYKYDLNALDAFYEDRCPDRNLNCGCHDAWKKAKQDHPLAHPDMYVANLANECIPIKHHVPQGMKIGGESKRECVETFQAMIKAGSHTYVDDKGGQPHISCGGHHFPNVAKSSLNTANAPFDDQKDHMREQLAMQRGSYSSVEQGEDFISVAFFAVTIMLVFILFTDGFFHEKRDHVTTPLSHKKRQSHVQHLAGLKMHT